ncbi:MAG TPA: hypothetical protein ENG74_00205, partial [Thermoplasmatales archaeon]|nr:hypothetical protein [Thermoplasmatales archaeon]
MVKKAKKSKLMEKLKIQSEYYVRLAVTISASAVVLISSIMAMLTFLGIVEGLGSYHDYIVIAILGGTGIYGGYTLLVSRRIQKMERAFPDFVRDLAESKKSGMTFTKAIFLASKGNYGELTPEIQKMARQISWGQSVNDALLAFAERVNTPLVKRIISLIVEASKGGGSTADVLEAAAKDAAEIKFLQSERKSNMASYVAIVYIGAIAFLAIILVL